ncbi:hypothetical protein SAMN04488134_11566 [Amphibacillus marinus]|uniref:Uncharacterized protein n=1 Tax=Amphibacillus marinus TaxID=872970 RepID=A0A1H8TC50_9BACI|nr:hypothetical protein [Amphibacillus marinus]SEO88461.1 hypothetical protein SAMN04488134_11566 [Amphibacillus marinus]
MKRSKKGLIIIITMIGLLAIAGTTYGIVQHQNDQRLAEQLKGAEDEVRASSEELDSYLGEQGFMTKELEIEQIETITTNLVLLQTNYSDMAIRKDTLKETADQLLHNIATLLERADLLLSQHIQQEALNQFFVEAAITEDEVTAPAIAEDLDHNKLEAYKKALAQQGFDEETAWYQAVTQLLAEASEQLDQIDTAEAAVTLFFDKNEVKADPSRDDYNATKAYIDLIRNEAVKEELAAKLGRVLTVIEEKEAEARRLAEEKAKREAEALALAQAEQARQQSAQASSSGSSASSSSEGSFSSSGSNSSSSRGNGGTDSSKSTESGGGSNGWVQTVNDEVIKLACDESLGNGTKGCATYNSWRKTGTPEDFKDLFED